MSDRDHGRFTPLMLLFLRFGWTLRNLIDWESKSQEITLMKYMDDPRGKEDKVYDEPALMRTPIVRNGKQVTVGYCPDVWAKWE